jgi:ABC-type nitrate/sulfonate/bicarbonate transport system substrate-binding protein
MQLLYAAVLLALAGGCSRASATKRADKLETLVIRYEGVAGTVTAAEIAADLGYLAPLELKYVGNNATGGPHSIQAVVTGDIDVGGSFNGPIIKLTAAKAPLKAVIASYGTDERNFLGYYVLADSPIRNARDLIGKKVAVNTLGAHAEFALREYLARGGLTPEEAKQVSMVALPSINGELALREKQVEVACFSTIFRDKALERGGIRMLFSDYEMFGTFTAGSTVMSTRFLQANPNTARKYVDGVGKAFDWLRATPREQVIARMKSIIKKRQRNEDTSVVRHWIGSTIATKRGRLRDEDYQRWIDWLVRDGELTPGQVKPSDVYSNELQPAQVGSLR